MKQPTIEKVWAIQNLFFKNEDYRFALEFENSTDRVSLGYIFLTEDSPNYQMNNEIGWNQNDFIFYKSLHDAQVNMVALA